MQEERADAPDLPDLDYTKDWYAARRYDEVLVDHRWKSWLTPKEIQHVLAHPLSGVYAQMIGRFMAWLRGPVSPSPR